MLVLPVLWQVQSKQVPEDDEEREVLTPAVLTSPVKSHRDISEDHLKPRSGSDQIQTILETHDIVSSETHLQ